MKKYRPELGTTELKGRILYFYGPHHTDELIPTQIQIKHVHNTPAQYHSMSLKFATMVHEYSILFNKLLNQHERHDCRVVTNILHITITILSYKYTRW